MRHIIGTTVRRILGIDDTQQPESQVRYLKDVSKSNKQISVSQENLFTFIDSVKDKHGIEEISLFRKGNAIFSSEDDLENVTTLYETFERTRPLMDKRLLMLKDKYWVTIYEKQEFIFIIKRFVKMNEIELNALTSDILKNLDHVLLEERNIMESIYTNGII